MKVLQILKVRISRDEPGGHHGPMSHALSSTATSSSCLIWFCPSPVPSPCSTREEGTRIWEYQDGDSGVPALRAHTACGGGAKDIHRHCYIHLRVLRRRNVLQSTEVLLEDLAKGCTDSSIEDGS